MRYFRYLFLWIYQNKLQTKLRFWWPYTREDFDNFSWALKNALCCGVDQNLIPQSLEESILNEFRIFNQDK